MHYMSIKNVISYLITGAMLAAFWLCLFFVKIEE